MPSIEKTISPGNESKATEKDQESLNFSFSENRLTLIRENNKELIGKDRVFNRLFASIKHGWDDLDKKQKEETLDLATGLIEKLRNYHDSYVNLKGAAGGRFYFEDVKKIQEAAKNADQREKILHDSFIDALNILSRKMKKFGLDNSWRADDLIYGLTPEAAREKPKLWMFKIFGEPLPKAIKR